jgi:hypothetical protein
MASRYRHGRYQPIPQEEEDDERMTDEVVAEETDEEGEEEQGWPQPRLTPRSLIVRRPPGGFGSGPPAVLETLAPFSESGRGRGRAVRTIPPGQRQVVLYHGLPPRRASQPPSAPTPAARRGNATTARPQQTRRMHWLFWVGSGMLALLAGYLLLSTLAAWWQVQQDDWRYGNPRTFQTDAAVGHGPGTSHFLVVNLGGQVEIIECPAQDCTKAVIYPGPRLLGSGAALMPVTLSFADVNGDGKPDMLVHIAGQTFVWLNTGKQFRQATSSDHVSLPYNP